MATNSGNNSDGGSCTGTVKWFNDAKGYGFITPDGGNGLGASEEELFAHYSAINMSGFKTLKEGQKVLFDKTKGNKGWQATNVRAAGGDSGEHSSYKDNTAIGETNT